MRALKLFVEIALLAILVSCSKKVVISGIVLDNFGKAVEGATVKIENTAFTATTDKDGKYHIGYVPGKVSLVIDKSGYASANLQIEIAVAVEFPASNLILYKQLPGSGVYVVEDGAYTLLSGVSVVCTHKDLKISPPFGFVTEVYKECRALGNSPEIFQAHYLKGDFTIATIDNFEREVLYQLLDSKGLVWSEHSEVNRFKDIKEKMVPFSSISTPVGRFVKLKLPEGRYALIFNELSPYYINTGTAMQGYLLNTQAEEKVLLRL